MDELLASEQPRTPLGQGHKLQELSSVVCSCALEPLTGSAFGPVTSALASQDPGPMASSSNEARSHYQLISMISLRPSAKLPSPHCWGTCGAGEMLRTVPKYRGYISATYYAEPTTP